MAVQDDFAPTVAFAAGPGPTQKLDIRFTGSGSEYFRIWIVNLLLTLVTFTLYVPFARARRIAYFQNNTLVGGDPLGFHADPWKMFRGYLLVLLLGLGYWAVSKFLPGLTWLAVVVFMVLWPALWRASLQFRLRNTSWRGVRLSFQGDLKSAYLSMLPFFLPALVFVLFLPAVREDETMAREAANGLAALVGFVMLAFFALLPWLFARMKRYQHGGYAFAQERTQLQVGAGRFYALFFKTSAVSIVAGLLVGGALVLVALLVLGGAEAMGALAGGRAGFAGAVIMVVALGLIYLLMPLVTMPYFAARFQNLLWGGTQSPKIGFESALRFRDLFRVTLVNWLLIVVTLGFYWPFAKVRTARLKLEAMSLEVEGPVDEWISRAQRSSQGVLGDAAGDFFGIDMGL
ncbi:YjgN family protein [Hydrogenophaga sp.]|uniref:YjgN family protein n=1 Tax=Hydrogenophaga sp. TaxID=1904254 RepID=UPI0027252775|nr:YjgN family protein [Hydrogenophaga sp.]MDO9434250.1 YjgN family protein [Hydrogenophaga sp.]